MNDARFAHLFDPRTNLREIAKQWLLLAWHLADEDKRCPDCIWKHSLTAEALIDEARELDTKGVLAELLDELASVQKQANDAVASGDPVRAAAIVRGGRKGLRAVVPLVKGSNRP